MLVLLRLVQFFKSLCVVDNFYFFSLILSGCDLRMGSVKWWIYASIVVVLAFVATDRGVSAFAVDARELLFEFYSLLLWLF